MIGVATKQKHAPTSEAASRLPEGWKWKRHRHGTWTSIAPGAAIEEAKHVWNERDAEAKTPKYGRNEEARWYGYLGELALADYLKRLDVELIHDGGVNDRPDFMIDGVAVSHKNRHCNIAFRRGYCVTVNEEFLDDPVDVFSFSVYEPKTKGVALLGVIGRVEFVGLAKPSRRRVFTDPTRRRDLPVEQLWPVGFLGSLDNMRVRQILGLKSMSRQVTRRA